MRKFNAFATGMLLLAAVAMLFVAEIANVEKQKELGEFSMRMI